MYISYVYYIRMYIYIYIQYVYLYVCMYIYIYTYTHKHIYTHCRHLPNSPLGDLWHDQAMKQLTDAQCSTYSGGGRCGRWVKLLVIQWLTINSG